MLLFLRIFSWHTVWPFKYYEQVVMIRIPTEQTELRDPRHCDWRKVEVHFSSKFYSMVNKWVVFPKIIQKPDSFNIIVWESLRTLKLADLYACIRKGREAVLSLMESDKFPWQGFSHLATLSFKRRWKIYSLDG